MKKIFVFVAFATFTLYCSSCARGISPYEAANGKAKCRGYVK